MTVCYGVIGFWHSEEMRCSYRYERERERERVNKFSSSGNYWLLRMKRMLSLSRSLSPTPTPFRDVRIRLHRDAASYPIRKGSGDKPDDNQCAGQDKLSENKTEASPLDQTCLIYSGVIINLYSVIIIIIIIIIIMLLLLLFNSWSEIT